MPTTMSLLSLGLFALVRPSIAGYVLEDSYTPSNWFSKFDFFTGSDPTQGFVNYVDESTAQSAGLISSSSTSVYMGVDNVTVAPIGGRSSVRLKSTQTYNHGLVILDLEHMPHGCGTWPAFWMVGPDWPNNGEIDIIEGVNAASTNTMTLHTGPNCSITDTLPFTGSISTPSCYISAPDQPDNAGCSIATTDSATYGHGFNVGGGGVFAMLWTSSAISVFSFPRSAVPSDITAGSPDPTAWGSPLASFSGGCDIDSAIKDQQIVFDMTFCGDWAGEVWSSSPCAAHATTCDAYVSANPDAFHNAYWTVNSLNVYQDSSSSSTPVLVNSKVDIAVTTVVVQAPISTATVVEAAPTSTSVLTAISELPAAATAVAVATSSGGAVDAATSSGGAAEAATTTAGAEATTTTVVTVAQASSTTAPLEASWFGGDNGIPARKKGKRTQHAHAHGLARGHGHGHRRVS